MLLELLNNTQWYKPLIKLGARKEKMVKKILLRNSKELIIGFSIILSAIIISDSNQGYTSSLAHCYQKNFEHFIKRDYSENRAAVRARRICT